MSHTECWHCGWVGNEGDIERAEIVSRPNRRMCPFCRQDLDSPHARQRGLI